MNSILKERLKYKIKQKLKYFNVVVLSASLIIGVVSIKYKPMYRVSICGTELGYVQSKETLEEQVKASILQETQKNVDNIVIQATPEYQLTFVDKTVASSEEEIVNTVKQDTEVTYKFYELAVNNEAVDAVNTLEEAEDLVNKIKEDNQEQEELNVSIVEKYTQKEEEVQTTNIEVAKNDIQVKIIEKIEEQEKINCMPEINGIKLACTPISGTITSRYGASSRIRTSNHTGLDIAASTGTPIKAIAEGTVSCASYQGSYGELVKINHGNGLETWYAHASKIYVSVGEQVQAGEVIASVGSTGNSTGPHLHLEVRINGEHVNPQNYLYK